MSNSIVPPLFPEEPNFNYVWKESAKYKPAEERKVQSLSSAMDADEAAVRKNLLEYESLFAEKHLYNETVAQTYPTLYKNLTSVPFVATARDDMGNIIETEGWWNGVANAYAVARDTVAIGTMGTRAMLEGRDLYPYERRKIEQSRKLQQAHMQSEPGLFAAAAELAGTMQETLGYALAAGRTAAMVSGPAAPVTAPIAAGIAAFATSFNLEAGNLYAELQMDGYTPAEAGEIASSYGALIAGFESVGLKFAGAPFKRLAKEIVERRAKGLLLRANSGQISGRILADYGKGILAESFTEGVQEVIGQYAQLRASQLYRPDNLYEPEYYESFVQAFTHTAKGMVIIGGIPSAIRLANDNVKSANANHDYKKAKESAEIRGRSKAPEAQRQIDAEASETDALHSTYYVRAQDFKNAISEGVKDGVVTEKQVRDTVEANSPGLMARIDEAAERDGEVELTKTDFENAFDNTLFRETALSNTAFQEDGMTKREADEVDRVRDKMVKERGEEAAKDLQDMDKFERELREVRQEVRRDLEAALKGTDAEQTMNAAANASVLIGFIRRAALQRNIGPREFVEKHLPEIIQQNLDAKQQAGNKSRELASGGPQGDWSHFPGAKEAAEGTRKDQLAFAKATGIRALENVDGWVFFEMPNGIVAGNLVKDRTDMSWPDSTLLEFMQETKATFISTPAHELTADEYVQNLVNMVDNDMFVREFLESQPDFEPWKGIPLDKLIDEKVAQYESDPYSFEATAISEHADAVRFALSQGDYVPQRVLESAKLKGDENILESSEGDQKKTLGKAVFTDDVIKKILLDPNAKPTTLMHELMHWNLEMMASMGLDIESKMAQEGYEATMLDSQMLSDIQSLLKWSGFEGTLSEWSAMSIDQRREFHEVIAMSFERYLYEGVAPSRELRNVFSRLASYIAGKFDDLVNGFQTTYNEIRKQQGKPEQPLPGLNDDVRAIFGRMMSAERDVQAFLNERELDAIMMTKDEWVKSGRNAQEYDEYEEEFQNSIYEAKAEMTQKRIEEAKTFANAYALIAQKQRGELQRITKQIRQEVEDQTKIEPVYQFLAWMRTGFYQSENGQVEFVFNPRVDPESPQLSKKLHGAIVKAVAPELYEELKRRKLISKNGMTLESVREMFNFESTGAMLKALATHRNFKDEVLHRTNQRLLNEHTDLMDPIVQQDNVHRAVHNKIRQKVIARELKFLLQNGRRSKVELELANQVAVALIEKTPTGLIDVAAYSRAAARARKKSLKAFKDGDIEAARFAKRQELINEQMVVEGLKARKEVRSLVESNKRAFKHRSDSALAKAGYDVTVMKALRAVLSRLGIGNVDFDPNEALARFAKEDPEFADEVGGNIVSLLSKDIAQPRVGDRRKPMEHLTLGDIRVLRLLSARMMLRAKNKLTAKIGENKQRVEAAQNEAAATLENNVKDGGKDLDGKQSIFGKIRNYFSDLIRFEHLFRRADANKVGIWTRMFRMVKDAGNRYREEVKGFTEDFGDRLRALDLTLPGGNRELEMTVLGNTIIVGQNGRNVKSQLIHLAMHFYGNASNRERLVRGYAGKDATVEQMEQAERDVEAFLKEQVRQGVLTRKDFEFMQETFKQLNGSDMLGRAQKVMMRLRHYEMNTIESDEFSIEFPDGTEKFMGGYIPVRYDRSESGRADAQGLQDEDMSIDQQAKRMLSILPSFAKDRTSPEGEPLELNLANIQHHAAEVFRFIHMSEPVTEVYKVVSGKKVQRTFIRKFGTKAYRNMEGWLKRSAYQKMDRDEDTEVGNLMLAMSRNANKGVMFLNIGNSLQNYAGLVIPMRRVGARRIISALMGNMFSKGPRIEAMEKSTELRLRVDRQIFDIYNQQNQLLTQESGVWDKIGDWSNRYAYFLQQWTQNHVDVAVWQAAYNQETERALREFMGDPEGAAKAEARAIAYADSIVRQTQMAGEKEDLSHFESQGSIYRAMFPFKSWFINWMNNAANQGRLDLDKQGQAKAAALASSYMYLLMLPAMLALAATELARGEDFDDDDDGYGDDMFELWWRSQAEQIVGGLPVASDLTRMIDSFWLDDQYWNNRYPATPWQRILENIIKAPMKKDTVDATASVVSQLADLMGVPVTRVWNSVNLLGDEFISGDLRSESTYDLVRGAFTGKRSASQRL